MKAESFRKTFKLYTNQHIQNSFVINRHRYHNNIQIYQSDSSNIDNKWSDESINDNLEKLESIKISLSSLILGIISITYML